MNSQAFNPQIASKEHRLDIPRGDGSSNLDYSKTHHRENCQQTVMLSLPHSFISRVHLGECKNTFLSEEIEMGWKWNLEITQHKKTIVCIKINYRMHKKKTCGSSEGRTHDFRVIFYWVVLARHSNRLSYGAHLEIVVAVGKVQISTKSIL